MIDASVVVNALLPTPARAASWAAMTARELWAPAILDAEVLSAVARLERAGQITTDEADDALCDLLSLPVERVPVEHLAAPAWALRSRLRISDALYVAAARDLAAELITADARLTRAPGLEVAVVLVPST